MRCLHALLAAVAISVAAAPIVASAEGGEHEEREGWRQGHDGDSWRENHEERQEERREERREEEREQGRSGYNGAYGWDRAPSYNLYSYSYDAPTYDYSYGNVPRCQWVVRRYYDEDGDLVARRVRVCY